MQNTVIVYDDKGTAILAYTGNMNDCKALGKASTMALHYLHRT
jgi:hypothetical protein